jgi:hypothetical protein
MTPLRVERTGIGMRRRTGVLLVAVAAACALPMRTHAQGVDQVATVPPNVVLANYDSVPVGPFGGLEASAYVTRVCDPSAAWFNPAGLSRQRRAQISGSAGVYEWTAVSPQALPNKGGSLQQLPNFVGFTFRLRDGFSAGAVLLTTSSWNQETDSELITTRPDGRQRVAYSADSELTQRSAAFGLGYQRGNVWRVGAGIAFTLVDLRLVQSISDRIADATGLRSLLVVSRVSGSARELRAQGGVQYDTARLRVGAAIRSPGLTVRRVGALTLDGSLDLGASSLGASLFDAHAHFEYRLPWEVQAGAAYIRDRVEIEIDVQGYSSIAAYSLLSTAQPTLIYGDAGGGAVPTVLSQPFGGLTSASNAVFNVTLGGHVRPIRSRELRVHGGFATSQSPAGAAEQVFNQVDLSSWSVGVSGQLAKFQFAIGFNRRTGIAHDVLVHNLLDGDPFGTNVSVRTAGLIYSVGYQF